MDSHRSPRVSDSGARTGSAAVWSWQRSADGSNGSRSCASSTTAAAAGDGAEPPSRKLQLFSCAHRRRSHVESISERVQGERPRWRGRLERMSAHTNKLFRAVDQSERLTILTRAVLAPPLLSELAVSARVHEDNSLTSIHSRTVTPMLKVCRAPKTHT